MKIWGELMKKKKCLFLLVMMSLLLIMAGCGKNEQEKVEKKLQKKMNDLSSYYLDGNLVIYSNNEEFDYTVKVNYMDKDYYRVNLLNNKNGHEQIILKNDEGVFVITPSLNKSFKFQSDWPDGSSQVYLITSIWKDISSDDDKKFEKFDNGYRFTMKANYPNNSNLVKQVVEFDNDLNFTSINVYDEANVLQMSMKFNKIELNKKLEKNIFEINSIINDDNKDETNDDSENPKVSLMDDVVYPIYVPTGTVLTGEEKVSKTDGERVILTFDGEKPFILVEETASIEKEFAIIPTYGEPYLLVNTVAALSDNSISWVNNGVEYYLVSDVMSQIELVEIASSLTKIAQVK